MHRKIVEWKNLNPKDVCSCCLHYRKDHSDMEQSLGNDSHQCDKTMKMKGNIWNCSCGRFEK